MKSRRPTISDIAKACDVSLSTVSLVLNDNPRISEKTRTKVLQAVEDLGYHPNIQARALASRSSQTLSVVVPNINHVFADLYFGEIVSGIYEYAAGQSYKILLEIANDNYIREKEYLKLMQSRRVDGMLFIASSMGDEYLRDFESTPYPFILINHFFPGSKLNYITVDYALSARLAAEHLIDLGHKSIGFIAGVNTYTGVQFRDEFLRACMDAGLRQEDVPWADGGTNWSQEGGFCAARQLLEQNPHLTAIMAANDRMAIGAMHYIQTRGLRVPHDISVIGADDTPFSRFTTPELTTIHHPIYEVGAKACELLLGMFRGEYDACEEVVSVSLKVRGSTSQPPVRPSR